MDVFVSSSDYKDFKYQGYFCLFFNGFATIIQRTLAQGTLVQSHSLNPSSNTTFIEETFSDFCCRVLGASFPAVDEESERALTFQHPSGFGGEPKSVA